MRNFSITFMCVRSSWRNYPYRKQRIVLIGRSIFVILKLYSYDKKVCIHDCGMCVVSVRNVNCYYRSLTVLYCIAMSRCYLICARIIRFAVMPPPLTHTHTLNHNISAYSYSVLYINVAPLLFFISAAAPSLDLIK